MRWHRGVELTPARLFVASFALLFLFAFPVHADAVTNVYAATFPNTGSITWTIAGSPYVILEPLSKRFGAFTINPGVVVKFSPGMTLSTHADVALNILGTAVDPVYFTSLKDDTRGGDTNADGAGTMPAPGDWASASFGGGSWNNNMNIQYLKVRYGGSASLNTNTGLKYPMLLISFPWFSGSPGVSYALSNIEASHSVGVGLYLSIGQSNGVTISNSSFRNNGTHGIFRSYTTNASGTFVSGTLNARNNWWGSASGPYHPTANPAGLGNAVDPTNTTTGSVLFNPWLIENPLPDPIPAPTCCSSVLFLPGIMGLRLYDSAEKLWEPSGDSDIQALYLNAVGESFQPNVYVTEVIDSVPVTGNRVYQSFLDDLEEKKTVDHAIANYAAVPYDWRLSIPDILASGKEEAGGKLYYNRATTTPYIEQTLRHLADESFSGKVTIVAHSNGGLLAKALINQLGTDAVDLVDKLILVAVPQTGTPLAVGSLLHGFDTGLPFDWFSPILSPERARDFVRNAPFAYQLLPHPDYYQGAGSSITTPLIIFEEGIGTEEFINTYGTAIGNIDDLHRFIRGEEGRVVPAFDDLKNPSVGNAAILAQSLAYLGDIDSSWVPPVGIEVHQIAGIGEDTLAGITYSSGRTSCVRWITTTSSTPWCAEYATGVLYTPNEVVDGDGTVVTPSALAMSDTNENIKRWWFDLGRFNDQQGGLGTIPGFEFLRTRHGNIFEANELRSFIVRDLFTGAEIILPQYVNDVQPTIDKGKRLRFVLHSPLSLTVADQAGHTVGQNVATIPGASYRRYGEVQVVWVPADVAPTLTLEGEADGVFTLEVEEFDGFVIVASTTFSGIPTTPTTVATMSFADGNIVNAGDLNVDFNNDRVVDLALSPNEGGSVTVPKIPLAVVANSETIIYGASVPVSTYSLSGFLGGETFVSSEISGGAACVTTAIATSPVGQYPITCTVGTLTSEYYDFETFTPGTLTIQYAWGGFLQPIDDPVSQPGITPSVFKAGSTVPVKFKLKDANGAIVQATVLPQWLPPVRGGTLLGNVDEPVYSGPATVGVVFKWDVTAQQYIYNWKTQKTDAGYWYRISTQLEDGSLRSVRIGLK